MTFHALLIGLGNIAQGYDQNSPEQHILTHAKAFSVHPGFKLYAGIDPDPLKRVEFSERYKTKTFVDIADLPDPNQRPALDVIALCSPTDKHFEHFLQAIELKPRLILCEKPLSGNVAQAEEMVRLAAENNISLCVNYMRRFEPGVKNLQETLDKQQFGKLLSGVVWFKRGVINNASHFVDLLLYLFGSPSQQGLINSPSADCEPRNFYLKWGEACVCFSAVDEAEFNYFEMELVGSKQRISYCDSGEHIYLRKQSCGSDMSQRRILGERELLPGGDFFRYQYHVQNAVYEYLQNGKALPSTGESALASLRIVCGLIDNERKIVRGELL